MKLHLCSSLLFLLFLVMTSSYTSARLLATKQGEDFKSVDDIKGESLEQQESTDSINKLLGMEICGNGDEECLRRRLIEEAHLDYIYTQQHKP